MDMESGLGYVSLCRFFLHNGCIEHLFAALMLVLHHVLLAHVVTFRFMLGLPFRFCSVCRLSCLFIQRAGFFISLLLDMSLFLCRFFSVWKGLFDLKLHDMVTWN